MSQDSELLYDEPDQWPHGTLSFTKIPEERSHTSEHIRRSFCIPSNFNCPNFLTLCFMPFHMIIQGLMRDH